MTTGGNNKERHLGVFRIPQLNRLRNFLTDIAKLISRVTGCVRAQLAKLHFKTIKTRTDPPYPAVLHSEISQRGAPPE